MLYGDHFRSAPSASYAGTIQAMRSFKQPTRVLRHARVACVFSAILSVVACSSLPPSQSAQLSDSPGMTRVNVRGLDDAQVREGVSFAAYTKLILDEPQLEFVEPDSTEQQVPLDQQQKQRFAMLLADAFATQFADLNDMQLVDEPGPGVLRLRVFVGEIAATVQPRSLSGVGRGTIFLRAVGNATLRLELSDAESGELLARGIDARVVEGAALAQRDGMITTWEQVEQLCQRWASVARGRLQNLVRVD